MSIPFFLPRLSVPDGHQRTVFPTRHLTLADSDVIFVIKDAELVEEGTHETLLAVNGVYAEMHRIQTPEGAPPTTARPAA
jgi:ABC-type transport system involved in Fe-S cluster assembly fused permease/ATPase subunit